MNNTRMKVGAWSVDEHERCAESLISHGLSYESMSKFVGTRTPSQITKYYARKKRKLVQDSKKYIVQSDESEVLKDHSSEVKNMLKLGTGVNLLRRQQQLVVVVVDYNKQED
mmetsp:Transcript_11136/g.10792  ORF Transcript_11136/g.10792 Transcript_11136/m.10792 type:complete len:112 (-) Transcript_11136:509-844(-)